MAPPPPVLTLNSSGDPRQGEAFSVSAQITDSNEPVTTDWCAYTRWSVDAPDTLSSATGCRVTVKFGTLGPRQVRVSIQDSLGAAPSQALTLNVRPPPANPYPIIDNAWVTSVLDSGTCILRDEPDEATLDLTQRTCAPAFGPTPYFAAMTLQNPTGEALTYEWKLIVQGSSGDTVLLQSAESRFGLYSPGNTTPGIGPCQVSLTVTAPDPSRTKSRTVWTGKCTYSVTFLR